MRSTFKLSTVCLIGILMHFTSCVHYYYAPNAQNVPLLKEKNDTKLLVAVSGGDEFTGFEAQFSRAVTDKIGVMANFIAGGGSEESNNESGSGLLFEIGAGYYKPIGQKFVFEAYGGIGYGGVKNKYKPETSKVNFTRFFVQPSFGFTTRGFEIALSSRIAGLNYHSITSSSQIYDIEYIKDHKFSVLFEPALTIRGGWDKVKLQLQYVLSENWNNPGLSQERSNFNLGLYFNIGPGK